MAPRTRFLTVPTYFMLLVDNKTFTLNEAVTGRTERLAARPIAKTLTDVLAVNRGSNYSFGVATDATPRFAVGDRVTTRRIISANHTRLPAYARNVTGKVIAHHGAHLLPDKGALGIHEGEHLYTVSFTARELWGEDASAIDTVMLELWESYFVPA
jgi:hypothetical protein